MDRLDRWLVREIVSRADPVDVPALARTNRILRNAVFYLRKRSHGCSRSHPAWRLLDNLRLRTQWMKQYSLELAKRGSLKLLKWARDAGCVLSPHRMYRVAAGAGHLHVLKWSIGHPRGDGDENGALRAGQLACLKWLDEDRRVFPRDSLWRCKRAAFYGQLSVVEWACVYDFPLRGWDDVMRVAGFTARGRPIRKAPEAIANASFVGKTVQGSDGQDWTAKKVRKPRGGYTHRWVRIQHRTRATYTIYRNFPTPEIAPPFDVRVPFDAPRTATTSDIRAEIGIEQRQGQRPHMEDVTFARTWRVADGRRQIFALGVLDGHGGDATSRALRKVLPECLAHNLGDTIDLDDANRAREINAKIVLAFWQAQRQLDTDPHGNHRGSGSTATVCLWQGGGTMLWWAWVGDSEAVIALPTIGHKQLTTLDHKPHTSEREDRRVERTGASFILRAVNQTYVRLDGVHIAMTRALGDTQSYEPFAAATDHQRHAAGYAVSPIPFVGSMDMGPCQTMRASSSRAMGCGT